MLGRWPLCLLGLLAPLLPCPLALRLLPESEEEASRAQWAVDVATHAALPPVARNATPRAALLELGRRGHPHRRGRGSQPRHFWLFGAHHKTGTVLMDRLALLLGRQLEQPTCSISGLRGPCGGFGANCWEAPEVRIWFDCHLSAASLERVRAHAGGALRAMHIIRDPVALVVSGYVYHLRSNDGPQGTVLRRVGLAEGLALEAQAALEGPLKEMLAAYREGAKGGDVLVLHLEDFMDSSVSFDAAAQRLFRYAVGDLVEKRTLEALVRASAAEDLRRHNTSGHSTSLTDPELKRRAALAFEGLPRELREQLFEYRSALGYA